MRSRKPVALCAALLGTLSIAGCSDEATAPLEPVPEVQPPAFTRMSGDVCEVIDFEDNVLGGDFVTQVAVLGLMLGIEVDPFPLANGRESDKTQARAFFTRADPTVWKDDADLIWRDENDPSKLGDCPGCEPLGNILVVEDERGFFSVRRACFDGPCGDARAGGEIRFSGLPTGEEFYIKAFTAVDVDPDEPGMRLLSDNVLLAESKSPSNGSVQIVTPGAHTLGSSFSFVLGTPEPDRVTGSGGIDNVELCRRTPAEELGHEGCTLGYWKNHESSWGATGYNTSQTLESVFELPDSYGLDDVTLHDALKLKGGRGTDGAARLLLKQAVAALLSAAHPDVDYPALSGSVINAVNRALASNSRVVMLVLAGALDKANNAGCPLN